VFVALYANKMKNKSKSFLPHPNYKPMAQAFFSFLVCGFAFGIVQISIYLGENFKWLYILGYVLFFLAFITAVIYFLKFMWAVFIKGAWKKEHDEYLKNLNPKQPWE
jgi:hypothetical protein